jgi:hypothetical protein
MKNAYINNVFISRLYQHYKNSELFPKNQIFFQNKNKKLIIKASNVEKANRGIKLQF